MEETEEVTGEIKVKEFCSTNDEDEYEYEVTAKDGKSESKALFKAYIEKSVGRLLLPKLRQFCDLIERALIALLASDRD